MSNWRKMFFILLSINILVLVSIAIIMILPEKQKNVSKTYTSDYEFHVTATKESLSSFLNDYLKNQVSDNRFDYKIQIKNDVRVVGRVKVFASTIDSAISFVPKVEPNGDVKLKVTDFSLGSLNMSIQFVLNYMDHFYDLPKFVKVFPKEKVIEIRLSEMPLKNGMHVKAQKLDLQHNNITFLYYHSVK